VKTHFILLAGIACLLSASAPSIPHDAQLYRAQPAFGDDDPLDPADVRDFTNRDTNRIVGNITRALARKAPWVDVLDGGTMPSGVSDTVRSLVQERAVSQSVARRGLSFAAISRCAARPAKLPRSAIPSTTTRSAPTGAWVRWSASSRLATPLLARMSAAEEALKKQIIQLINADVRATLVDRSGCKLVVQVHRKTFEQMFCGRLARPSTPRSPRMSACPMPRSTSRCSNTSRSSCARTCSSRASRAPRASRCSSSWARRRSSPRCATRPTSVTITATSRLVNTRWARRH
jgi:hypothetical protein